MVVAFDIVRHCALKRFETRRQSIGQLSRPQNNNDKSLSPLSLSSLTDSLRYEERDASIIQTPNTLYIYRLAKYKDLWPEILYIYIYKKNIIYI